jgi:hypothetical protein
MKSLKNCIKLSSSVKIYVPSTQGIKERFDTLDWVLKGMELLSSHFGGATSSAAMGAWVARSGELVKEDVTIILAYASESALSGAIDKIYDFCVEMKNALTQEAIALEVNGELYLI